MEWATEGDRNTHFYQAMIKGRRSANTIHLLHDDEGRVIDDPQALSNHIATFYKALVGQAQPRVAIDPRVLEAGPKLEGPILQKLVEDVTCREVKEALWSIGNRKSPGPDGFSAGFYKSAWEVIRPSLTAALKEFFASGKLLKQINAIALMSRLRFYVLLLRLRAAFL